MSGSLPRLLEAIQQLSAARELSRVQEIVRSAARSLTGADGATFVLRDGGQCFYADEDAIAPLWKGRRFPMSDCVSGWVMRARCPAVIPDVFADERVPVDAYRVTFVKSLVMVPIRSGDPLGAIGCYWASHHAAGDEEVGMLAALADSASIAMENVRLFDELQEGLRQKERALGEAERELAARQRAEAELLTMEDQFRQSQKMEAIGRLAGGIAHDFNNLLAVVLSYSALLASDLPRDDPAQRDLTEIRRAAERAATLTRQLLAFSRQQVLETRTHDLREVVIELEGMLRRIIGEDVELAVVAPAAEARVRLGAGQAEQILMNLAVNARDAMPRGGRLTIEIREVLLTEEYAGNHYDVRPGRYVMLAVSDNGTGMDKATQARIFEPFFTTKEAGKGTGLGLSMVYGIVKQSGGHLWVYSEVGTGTTFKVYLPFDSGAVEVPTVRTTTHPSSRGETLVLVEDDDQLRVVVREILTRAGYVVLDAQGAETALEICRRSGATVDLLLTDIVMPRMSGVALSSAIAEQSPETAILYMSGYTDDAALRHGLIDSGVPFLQKPFTPATLLEKVRSVLGGRRAR